mmetsp:Transcript_133801/g.286159  ORF Transcript_133801/g.286159 Transcript_133801/m.286159 type:complete len:244 (+) Transcript_133801:396-1127(+)
MPSPLLDLGSGVLQVEERAAARGATDELRLGDAHPRCLQEVEHRLPRHVRIQLIRIPEDAFAHAVHEETSEVRGPPHHDVILILSGDFGVPEPENGWHCCGGFHGIQDREESPDTEGDTILRLGPQEDQPRVREFHGALDVVGRLLAGENDSIATDPRLKSRLDSVAFVDERGTRWHILARLAEDAHGHVEEGLQVRSRCGRDGALQDDSIDALPVLLDVAVRAQAEPEPLAEAGRVKARHLL